MMDVTRRDCRAATDPAGPTGRLATWLSQLRLDDVPTHVQARAKHLILDGIACAIVGAKLPWSRTAVEIVTALEGNGDCGIIGWGKGTTAPAATLLNGTFIQGFELDDYHPYAPLHSASVVLPALLACIDGKRAISGARMLHATIAGFEVGPRVGLALHGAQMLSRGWHSGSVFGTHAAAAAAGTLLGLDAAAFEDALGLAATQSAGLMAAQYEAMSKRMHHGFSARNGLYAAHLAAGGYTGIKRVYERDYGGFLSTFGEGHAPDPTQIAGALGERWETERIVVKPYAAMGGLHAPLDALFEIAEKRPLRAQDIRRIDVFVSHSVYHHGWWVPQHPLTPIGAQMNLAYALAVAIVDGKALVQQFAPDRINRDDVWEVIPRIVAHHEEGFDAAGPSSRGRTRLRIEFSDGEIIEAARQASRAVLEPLGNDAIVAKYRELTRGLIADDRQSDIETAVLALDALPDVEILSRLLLPETRGAF
jgi:2-methylcitrate dehydratase PrpD